VLAVGVVPLIVIRNSGNIDALLVPVVGSLALAIICTAVVACGRYRHLASGRHGAVPDQAARVVATGRPHAD
jgi:hypothetical protein